MTSVLPWRMVRSGIGGNSAGDGTLLTWLMVKLIGETLKNMFPAASTRIRHVGQYRFGSSTLCAPTFGTFEASTMGKESPPSVESRMFTLAALTAGVIHLDMGRG